MKWNKHTLDIHTHETPFYLSATFIATTHLWPCYNICKITPRLWLEFDLMPWLLCHEAIFEFLWNNRRSSLRVTLKWEELKSQFDSLSDFIRQQQPQDCRRSLYLNILFTHSENGEPRRRRKETVDIYDDDRHTDTKSTPSTAEARKGMERKGQASQPASVNGANYITCEWIKREEEWTLNYCLDS